MKKQQFEIKTLKEAFNKMKEYGLDPDIYRMNFGVCINENSNFSIEFKYKLKVRGNKYTLVEEVVDSTNNKVIGEKLLFNKVLVRKLEDDGVSEEWIPILTREDVVNMIIDLNTKDIVATAYASHVSGMKSGYAQFDLETGILAYLGVEEKTESIKPAAIILYKLDKDFSFDETILLTKEEMDKYQEMKEEEFISVKIFLDNKELNHGDSYEERILNYLSKDYLDWKKIEEQLNQWYI